MRQKGIFGIDRIFRFTSVLSAIALLVMMAVTVIDVGMSNMMHRPIIGAFDLVVTALVFAIFLGIPVTFQREGNIVVDVVDHFVPDSVVKKLRVLARILSLVFLAILLFCMVDPALDAYKYGERKQELGLPLYVIWIPMLVGVGFAIFGCIDSIVRGRRAASQVKE